MPDLPVLTVTLNPALDLTATTQRVVPHRKLRCLDPRYDPGGGGINVSRAMHLLGGDGHAFAVLAGSTGDRLQHLLDGEGIASTVHRISGETRTSMTVMEAATGEHFRFVLPGPAISKVELDSLLPALERTLQQDSFAFVVLSGSLLPGMPVDFYASLIRLAERAGSRVILDAKGAELEAAVSETPYLIRLNHLEAQELVGGADAEKSAHALAQRLVDQQAAEVVIVAIGELGSILATNGQWWRIVPPNVETVSPVGAGDSFVGGLTLALARGQSLIDAARFGVAAAASAVTTPATQLCDRETTQALCEECVVLQDGTPAGI